MAVEHIYNLYFLFHGKRGLLILESCSQLSSIVGEHRRDWDAVLHCWKESALVLTGPDLQKVVLIVVLESRSNGRIFNSINDEREGGIIIAGS